MFDGKNHDIPVFFWHFTIKLIQKVCVLNQYYWYSQEDFLSSFSWSIHNCTFQRFGGKINHFLLVSLHLISWQSTWNWIERKNHPAISHQMLQILTVLPTRVAGFHWKAFTAPSATVTVGGIKANWVVCSFGSIHWFKLYFYKTYSFIILCVALIFVNIALKGSSAKNTQTQTFWSEISSPCLEVLLWSLEVEVQIFLQSNCALKHGKVEYASLQDNLKVFL